MAERPRILFLQSPDRVADDLWQRCQCDADVTRVQDSAQGLALLRSRQFDAVFADTTEDSLWAHLLSSLQAERVLNALTEGVAVVTPDLRITWSNPAFDRWCGGPPKGQTFYDALGSPQILGPDYCPFHTALAGKSVSTRMHCRENRYVDLQVTSVIGADQKVTQLISLGRDVTALVQQQQKLNALHRAGSELAALNASDIADMSVAERVELLKQNIRRLTHDLLHYDVIEIRLLDSATGRLDPLLQEGMTPEASGRVLHTGADGQGITGLVAASGKSYLCPDTTKDSHYLQGSQGARSSLTVPLITQDKVIGTFNIESPRTNAFSEEDVQFAETYGREIAAALHTLELLTAEKRSATSQSVEAINRAVVLPVDEILAAGLDPRRLSECTA